MKLKKLISGVLAFTGMFACVGTFSACETSHPRVEMQIEFNDNTYTVEYKLYRKVAPATVEHFLALVDAEYYNGVVVHDYADSRMYTGGYSYSETAEYNLDYKEYYTFVQGVENFPHTVWRDQKMTAPTYTLYGEFSANDDFEVENGVKKESFGSLTMYYTSKDSVSTRVTAKHPEADGEALRAYKNNCATSLFYISLTSSEKSNSNYCTFATLEDDSVETMQDLQAAIEEYIEDNYDSEDDFLTDAEMEVDGDDPYLAEAQEVTYAVPKKPIEITSVKVLRY